MVPISRHFLPELQPEPLAWLTTGLMKGSRLPFAAYLVSGVVVGCSGSGFSPAPALATLAGELLFSVSDLLVTMTTGGTECRARGRGLCFGSPPPLTPA